MASRRVDPSQETKQELKGVGISCLMEFGQAARFLLRNSALQDVCRQWLSTL